MPELSERNFCDVLEMKWDAASWCATNSCQKRYSLFYFRLVIPSAYIGYKFVFHYHQLPHGA